MSLRERKKEASRQNIIDTAIELFKEKGYDQTSINDILEGVGISKGTLYNYFPDKESILIPYFQNYFKSYRDTVDLDANFSVQLMSLLDFIEGLLISNRELTYRYFMVRMTKQLGGFALNSEDRSGLENVLVQILNKAQENGEIATDYDTIFLARSLTLMIFNLLLGVIREEEIPSFDRLKRQVMHLFISGAERGWQEGAYGRL